MESQGASAASASALEMNTVLRNQCFVWRVFCERHALRLLSHPWHPKFLCSYAKCQFRKDHEKLKVSSWGAAFIFLRASEWEQARDCCLSCRCIYMRTCVYVFFSFTGRNKHGAIPLLTSLMFHVLTCCLIFKLSCKSQQPLVGKASWEHFKCIYNFYLPSLPVLNAGLCKWD